MYETPRYRRTPLRVEKPLLTEWRFGLIGLVTSLLVITAKVLHANQEEIKHFFVEKQLFETEIFNAEGNLMYMFHWKNVVKFSNLWLPALCGALTTYFTWMMVYLDSHVPGVQPPSPFSPTKYKMKSGHSFHLNYVFAVVVGVLVASYMYWRGISLVF